MNVLNNITNTENGNSILIGQLILDELKCIRKELKEEIRKLGDKFQEFIAIRNGLDTKALNYTHHNNALKCQESKHESQTNENNSSNGVAEPVDCAYEKDSFAQNTFDVSECFEDIKVPDLFGAQKLTAGNCSLGSMAESNADLSILSEAEAMPNEEVVDAAVNIEGSSSDTNVGKPQNIQRKPLCGRKLRKSQPKKHKYTPSYSMKDYENDFETINNKNNEAEIKVPDSDFEHDDSSDVQEWHKLVKAHKYNYQCKICGRYFSQHGSLRRHLRIHTGEKPYKCKLCNKRFIRTDDLRLHMKKMHLPQSGEENSDSFRKIFGNPTPKSEHHTLQSSLLLSSVATTAPSRSPNASLALLANPVNNNAEGSIFAHNRERRNFLQHGNMSVLENYPAIPDHVRDALKTRNGKKIYKCNVCDKSFIYTSQSYRRHMMIHTGERPFTCEYCNKGFIRAANLRLHIRTHTGEKPFQCTYCNESFRLRPRLTKHLQSHMEFTRDIE